MHRNLTAEPADALELFARYLTPDEAARDLGVPLHVIRQQLDALFAEEGNQ